jgi:hypothetical protein
LADPSFCIALFGALADFMEGPNCGRNAARKAEAKEKEIKRDHARGTETDPRQQRGIALGATNQLQIATIAQNHARIANQQYEAEVVKRDVLLKSKGDQIKTEMSMAQLYFSMGDEPKAKQHMNVATSMMTEVKLLENELVNLRNQKPDYDAEVDAYLSRGRDAMGIESNKRMKISTCEGKTEEYDENNDSFEGKTEESDDNDDNCLWQSSSSFS